MLFIPGRNSLGVGSYLDNKEGVTAAPNQTDWCFPLFLLPCIVLVKPSDNWHLKKQAHHAQFQNVLYCNSSVWQNECINWIHHFRLACHCEPARLVFILNFILTFFKKFCPFVNICTHHTFFCKYYMVCTFQPSKV